MTNKTLIFAFIYLLLICLSVVSAFACAKGLICIVNGDHLGASMFFSGAASLYFPVCYICMRVDEWLDETLKEEALEKLRNQQRERIKHERYIVKNLGFCKRRDAG